MTLQPQFPRHFFENELPKLLELTDTRGNLPVISIGLFDGGHFELKEFKIADDGLLVRVSSEEKLVPYLSILSLQVMPRSFKQRLATVGWPQISGFPLWTNHST
jgi:hypothetical protein